MFKLNIEVINHKCKRKESHYCYNNIYAKYNKIYVIFIVNRMFIYYRKGSTLDYRKVKNPRKPSICMQWIPDLFFVTILSFSIGSL